jgi:hypothetical protein
MKYPTIRNAVHYLTYRYCIVPINPDGTLPWEDKASAADHLTYFDFPTKQYPYYITRVGKLLLKRLEGWYEMDRLAAKFTLEDLVFFTTTKEKKESIFMKPNRFVKPKKRTIPKERGFKDAEARSKAENAYVDENKTHTHHNHGSQAASQPWNALKRSGY